jgi:leucyl-tRNA synthetase
MELLNELYRFEDESDQGQAVMRQAVNAVVLMLSPIVPHITQNLWQQLGHDSLIAEQAWPRYDEAALERDSIELVVQINGKLRSKIHVPADADNDAIENIALKDEKIRLNIQDKTVRKVIVVPGRLVNLVVA